MISSVCIILSILASPVPEWTVACYIAADNSLEDACRVDLEEMESVGSTGDVNIVVQVDWRFSTDQRYLVERGVRTVLSDLGEINSGSPETLANFGIWAFNTYPAKHYLLIIWDHGDGWSKGEYLTKWIGYDESSGDYIGIADGELKSAILDIKNGIKRKIDIVAFDACLMQMIEVLTEIKDGAHFAIGSEERIPVQGFPYDDILLTLTSNPHITPKGLADSLVVKYIASYSEDGYEVTLSRVDLSCMNDLKNDISGFCTVLRENATDPAVKTARDNVQTFGIENSPPLPQDDYIDLHHFASLVKDNASLDMEQKALEVIETISQSIFSDYSGEWMKNANGISIWFPDNYFAFINGVYDYINLDFAETTEWEKFVYAFYNVPDTIPPTTSDTLFVTMDRNNSYTVWWEDSYDLSDVSNYELREIFGLQTILMDDVESDGSQWELNNFAISSFSYHSPNQSFFTHNGWMKLKNPLEMEANGRLTFWCCYSGRDGEDFLYIDISIDGTEWIRIDSLTGIQNDWAEMSYDLSDYSGDSIYLKFEYHSDGSSNRWVYLDDVNVNIFDSLTVVSDNIKTNFFHFYHKPKGTYHYQFRAKDTHNNWSKWSGYGIAEGLNYCSPYNFPNPFTSATTIAFQIPESSIHITSKIYDASGRLVRTFSITPSPNHPITQVIWDGRDSRGSKVASGVYFYRLEEGDKTATRKLVLMR